MTQQEFTSRTKVAVSESEFWAINEVYNNSDLNKDEFCKWWKKANKSRVKNAIALEKQLAEQEKIADRTIELIGKLSWGGDAFKYHWYYTQSVVKLLNKKDIELLEKLGIPYKFNSWGGQVSPSDVVYDLKVSLAK